jgi:type II secretory ATPase GspE/PulE/Tfp pilus assembly ATPase PilB-like protein
MKNRTPANRNTRITETKVAPAPIAPPQLIDVTRLQPEAAVEQLIEHAVSIGGIIRTIAILSVDQGKRCLGHVRAAAGMDVTEKRKPGDGRWIFQPRSTGDIEGEIAEPVDLRLNAIPTLHGEDIAIRLLSRGNKIYALDKLGMTGQQLDTYRSMITSPSGLILISGPTGSGKTATLYSSLMQLNDGKRKINTIEDPIEYAIDGLRQSQTNPAIDLSFADLLRGVLRQGPDVIMVGEIRDEETAHTAVRAANSGLLVFATVHAASAAATVQSMRALNAHPRLLSTALLGVVSQRLVRTLCPACRVSFDLSDAPETFEDLRPFLKKDEGNKLFAPVGCDKCGQTGYAAQTGVFEVMKIDRDLRHLIGENASIREIRDAAIERKMLEFRHSAMLKVARGETCTEEVFRVVPCEEILAAD